jgi:hypothetical protein
MNSIEPSDASPARKSRICSTVGVVLLTVAIFADGLPRNASNGFGALQIVATLVACLLIWMGAYPPRALKSLAELKNTVFKINCGLLLGIVFFAGLEAVAYIIVTVSPPTAISKERGDVQRRAEAAALASYGWVTEHKANMHANPGYLFYRPYFLWAPETQESSTLNIDDEWGGIRRTVPQNPETAEAIEIFLFGGSTMFCIESPDTNTIASEVAAELEHRYPNQIFNVVNLAGPGFINDQEIVRLTQAITDGAQPDLVAFYDGTNEKFNKVARGHLHFQFERFKSLESNQLSTFDSVVDFILRYDYIHFAADSLFDLQHQTVFEDLSQDQEELKSRANRMADRYRRNVDFVAKLGWACEFETVHFWQPDLFNTGKKLTLEENRILDDVFNRQVVKAHQIGDKAIAREMAGVTNFHDISAALDGVEQSVFFDFCHVSATANRAIAMAIVDSLQQGGQLQRAFVKW